MRDFEFSGEADRLCREHGCDDLARVQERLWVDLGFEGPDAIRTLLAEEFIRLCREVKTGGIGAAAVFFRDLQ